MMLIKLFKLLKWLFLLFVFLSVISTIITLLFNDFKPDANYMGKKRPAVTRDVKTKIDRAVDPYLAKYPNATGLYLLDDNLEAYADRILLAKSAERTLDLQYYIWHDDITGGVLGRELLKAADRGVFVRILLDDLNSVKKDSILAGLAQHPYIEIRLFNPVYSRRNIITRTVEMLFRGLSLNRRMHNKMMIADGQIAIIGGRNIGNEYFDADPNTNFFDVDLLLIGQAIKDAEDIFETFWDSQASIPAKQVRFLNRGKTLDDYREMSPSLTETEQVLLDNYKVAMHKFYDVNTIMDKQERFVWTKNAHIYSDPPEKVFGLKEEEWLVTDILPKMWMEIKSSLYLVSPYFVPGDEGVKVIARLGQQNKEVTILTNSLAANDVAMVHAGYAPYRKGILQSGAKLYELMPFNVSYKLSKERNIGAKGASLHTKAFVIDNRVGFVGSFNMDPRSARLNTEMGVFFESPEIISDIMKRYQDIITKDNSYEVILRDNQLIWIDESHPEYVKEWKTEPETSWFNRMIVKVVSWLPIESQL